MQAYKNQLNTVHSNIGGYLSVILKVKNILWSTRCQNLQDRNSCVQIKYPDLNTLAANFANVYLILYTIKSVV